MRKRLPIPGAAVAGLVLATIGSANANPPKIVVTPVSVTFPAPYYTNLCGFAVQLFNVGTLNSKLYVDRTGAIIREIDTTQCDQVGWNSPDTGKVIIFPNSAQLTTGYPFGFRVVSLQPNSSCS